MDINSLGRYFAGKMDEMRMQIKNPADIDDPTLEEINNFQKVFPMILDDMVNIQPAYNLFDIVATQNISITMDDPVMNEMEHDLFDAVLVDDYIPFVSLNLDSIKMEHANDKFLSDDRRFKLHYPVDCQYITSLHRRWSEDKDLNVPYTMIVKVWSGNNPPSYNQRTQTKNFIDFVFEFGKGWSVKMDTKTSTETINRALATLNNHLHGYELARGEIIGISASFPIDHYIVKPSLFREILMNPHTIRADKSIYYGPFMWLHEAKTSQGVRSHFKVQFKMANLQQKITISTGNALHNTLFYQNKIPHEFTTTKSYHTASMTGLKSLEEAILIKYVLTSAFFMYGYPYIDRIDQYKNHGKVTAAFVTSELHSRFLGRAPNDLLTPPFQFGPSFKLSYAEMHSIAHKRTNILNLKSADPTFYRGIATGRAVSGKQHQPLFLVRTTDMGWEQILGRKIYEITNNLNNGEGPPIQIIRYPFVIENPTEEYRNLKIENVVMPPYFLIGDFDTPYFQIKPNLNPEGSDDTIHPFILSTGKNKSLSLPGNGDYQILYQQLLNLNQPFIITMPARKSETRTDNVRKTMTVLAQSRRGHIPEQLETILKDHWAEYGENGNPLPADKLAALESNVYFNRVGTGESKNSIIKACLMSSPIHNSVFQEYAKQDREIDREMWLNEYRSIIANNVNWNKCRQELYDMSSAEAKAYFLDPNTTITYYEFKSVLESFFNAYILTVKYDKPSFEIEIPRHKFFYIPDFTYHASAIVLIKHKSANKIYAYEPIESLYHDPTTESNPVSIAIWPSKSLFKIFKTANESMKISFKTAYNIPKSTIHHICESSIVSGIPYIPNLFKSVKWQYIDSAGKMRGFLLNNLLIWCDPTAPIPANVINDPENLSKPEIARSIAKSSLTVVSAAIKNSFTEEQYESIQFSYSITGGLGMRSNASDKGKEEMNEEVSGREIVKMTEFGELITGVWFRFPNIPNFRFYAPTTPSKYPEQDPNSSLETQIAIENDEYFTAGTEEMLFQNHDYMERLANVMIQIWQNLYLYWGKDDPEFFTEYMCEFDEEKTPLIDFDTMNRRLPIPNEFDKNGYPIFANVLQMYAQLIPGIFEPVNREPGLEFMGGYKMIVDSPKIRMCFKQQARTLQKLKQDIFGSEGHAFRTHTPRTLTTPKIMEWAMGAYEKNDIEMNDIILNRSMIDKIPRLKFLFKTPRYIRHFYMYSTDYTVRSVSQTIFLSKGEMVEYSDLQTMDNDPLMIENPDNLADNGWKTPVYYRTPAGNTYIIQSVLGNSIYRAYAVIKIWQTEKMNLGYYASEWEAADYDIPIVDESTINNVDPTLDALFFRFHKREVAALLKVNTSVSFPVQKSETLF
tara:strand:+ start:7929 stop:12011 length:4083 start_codon:yes stop_codon:yes gene_type:complete